MSLGKRLSSPIIAPEFTLNTLPFKLVTGEKTSPPLLKPVNTPFYL
jgi:hypothetical protein